MKAAVYYNSTDTRLEEMADLEPGPGEALVEVSVCGLCGSDLMDWYSDAKAPTVLGHEIVGRVRALGLDASPEDGPLRVGDRVFVHHHSPCWMCDLCRRGFQTLCPGFKSSSVAPGGFAEQVLVPAALVKREVLVLPDRVTDEQAAFIEPLACCVRGVRRAAITPGARVAVVGLGQMGQLYVRAALAAGARVVAVDPLAERRDLASAVGAITIQGDPTPEQIRAAAGGSPFHAVVMCTGAAPAQHLVADLAGAGSVVQMFAPAHPEDVFPLTINRLFFEEITLQATYSADSWDIRQALALVAEDRVSVAGMVTHRFGLASTQEAMDTARARSGAMKVLIDPTL
ncbi:MAG: zinc-binding dehydrogenase [Arachnia sp.]